MIVMSFKSVDPLSLYNDLCFIFLLFGLKSILSYIRTRGPVQICAQMGSGQPGPYWGLIRAGPAAGRACG